jgi:hypothetical protein
VGVAMIGNRWLFMMADDGREPNAGCRFSIVENS